MDRWCLSAKDTQVGHSPGSREKGGFIFRERFKIEAALIGVIVPRLLDLRGVLSGCRIVLDFNHSLLDLLEPKLEGCQVEELRLRGLENFF